jgi:hypothetical protein
VLISESGLCLVLVVPGTFTDEWPMRTSHIGLSHRFTPGGVFLFIIVARIKLMTSPH